MVMTSRIVATSTRHKNSMHKKLSAALTSVVILSLFAIVIDASDNYTVNHGTNQNITAFTTCKKVTNSSATSASVYVPTQTDPEWQSFYTNPPTGVTIGSCVTDVVITPGANRNLCTLAGNPTTAGDYRFTLAAGGVVYSGSTASPALTTGTCWPAGSTVTIVNNGTIYGMGGVGGNGGNGGSGADYPTVGTAGGNAISLSFAVSIDNTNGFIYGGGGGGGGGARYVAKGVTRGGGGGGGGASGSTSAAGGTGGTSTCCGSGLNGTAGTTAGGGTGGTSLGGDGGAGGAFGAAGVRGANGSGSIVESGAAGGAAGKAVDMNGYGVTWIAGNTAAKVKGAVSN